MGGLVLPLIQRNVRDGENNHAIRFTNASFTKKNY
jgi:hypothetical protein